MTAKKTSTTSHETQESVFETHEKPVHHNPQGFFKRGKQLYFYMGAILTLILVLSIILYYYLHYQKNQQLLKNPLLASEMEQESIVKKVSRLMQLPANEVPTIAQVSDITKLQGQPFFENAQNGDMVLIYPKAQKAILYNPSMNRIINVGPIAINKQSVQGASTTALPTSAMPITIALYNGTTVAGLTKKVQADLTQQLPSVTVVENANASKQTYTQTIVVDLTGKETSVAKQLATMLHGTVGSLPAGEVAPANANTDIVVILGSNK